MMRTSSFLPVNCLKLPKVQKQVFEGFDQGLMPGPCSWFYADINKTKRQQKDGVGGLRKWQFLMMWYMDGFLRNI